MEYSSWMCSFLGNYTSVQAVLNKTRFTVTTMTTQVIHAALHDNNNASNKSLYGGEKLGFQNGPNAMSLPLTEDEVVPRAKLYEVVVLQYLIPALCIFGLFGNGLSIGILSKRLTEGVSKIERGSTLGLIGLAGSDFGFCIFTFFSALVPNDDIIFENKSLSYFMAIYGSYIINTFIKTSTAFTVILSIGRYYAVCFPLEARQYLKDKYTIVALIISAIFWFCCHIPLTWTMEGITTECLHEYSSDVITIHYVIPGKFTRNRALAMTMTYIWAVTGFFIPVSILGYCNYKLVASLIVSSRLRSNSLYLTRDGSSRFELTTCTSLEPNITRGGGELESKLMDKREDTMGKSQELRPISKSSSTCTGHWRSSHAARSSDSLRIHSMRSVQGRLSVTFISIVVMYFLLVCPSELLYFYCDVG